MIITNDIGERNLAGTTVAILLLIGFTGPALVQAAEPLIEAAPVVVSEQAPRRFDWKFVSLLAAATAANLTDMARTEHCLQASAACREDDWIYGPRPSAARLFGLSLAIEAGFALGSYELRRHGPGPLRRFWAAPLGYCAADHIQATAKSWMPGGGISFTAIPVGHRPRR
jgi:hypothetical protein